MPCQRWSSAFKMVEVENVHLPTRFCDEETAKEIERKTVSTWQGRTDEKAKHEGHIG